jgi:hypothetical protein
MSEETPVEEIVVEETPEEEIVPEEVPTEETVVEPAPVATPVTHTFMRSMTVPEEMVNYLADAVYPEYVMKTAEELPPRDTPYSLEEMRKPNPQSKIDFLQNLYDEKMLEFFIQRIEAEVMSNTREAIETFTAQANAQAQAVIEQKKAEIKALIVRG